MTATNRLGIPRCLSMWSGSVRPLETRPTLRFLRHSPKRKNHTRQLLQTVVRQPTALPADRTTPLVALLLSPSGRSLPARRTQEKPMLALVETRAVAPEPVEI